MSLRFDCLDAMTRSRGIERAQGAIAAGALVVLPTDVVYGLACDAFSPGAVTALRSAKGHGRAQPPPVMIPNVRTLGGIASGVSHDVLALAEAFWPGALTLLCRAQPSLNWDLGDTRGTVAVRMPLHPLALELLAATGPLAVTAANAPGRRAPIGCDEAREQLGDAVEVYLDAGAMTRSGTSTIVDCTGELFQVLRDGAVSLEELRGVVPGLLAVDG